MKSVNNYYKPPKHNGCIYMRSILQYNVTLLYIVYPFFIIKDHKHYYFKILFELKLICLVKDSAGLTYIVLSHL